MNTNRHNAAHVEVVRVVTAVLLAHGFEPRELPAAVAEVIALALEDIEGQWRTPRTLRDWQLLVAFVAKDYAVDERGKEPVELGDIELAPALELASSGESPEENPVEALLFGLLGEPWDRHEQLAVVKDLLAHGEVREETVEEELRAVRVRFFRRLAAVKELRRAVEQSVARECGAEMQATDAGADALAEEEV